MKSRIKPKISIITPTFNASITLERCIRSVIAQTYKNFEFIIVDGGSNDATLNIVNRYGAKIDKIISEPDRGIYDAMNKGIGYALGEWLFFLGADDRLYCDTVLEKIVDQLSDTTCEMVYGNVLISGDTSWGPKHNDVYGGEFTVERLTRTNICHQAIFYSKSVFDRLGKFNVEYPVCADWDFNHRCFAYGRVMYVDQLISVFAADGTSSSVTEDSFRNQDIVWKMKEYYGGSFFSGLFRSSSNVFLNIAVAKWKRSEFFWGVYFLLASTYHSKNKVAPFGRFMKRLFAPTSC